MRLIFLAAVSLLTLAVSVLIVIPSASPEPVQAQESEAVPRFESTSCPFLTNGQEVECGYLVVPENRDDPDSETIRLAVAVFHSTNVNPATDPLIFLDGGPGVHTLEGLGSYATNVFGIYLRRRDVIIFDQRGLGYSQPRLDCPEMGAASREGLHLPLAEAYVIENNALLECRNRLEAEGIDLAAYNSRENAADVRDLALTLGYEEWNLMGSSYGSRLALTIMRDYPEGVRSVVLDSVYPPEVDAYYFTNPVNFDRVLEKMFALCAEDEACNARYPNLRNVFYKVIEMHNAEPVTLELFDHDTRTDVEILMDGSRLLELFRSLFYDGEAIPYIPQIVYELRYGDYTTFELLSSGFIYTHESFSEGMHYAIGCGEDVPFVTAETLSGIQNSVDPRLWLGLVEAPDLVRLCQEWTDLPPFDNENDAIISDIPTLVLSGEYDPVTPPEWGELVADNLANSYVFEFPTLSHGVFVNNTCANQMAVAFLTHPDREPASFCMAMLETVEFVVE